MLVDGRQVTAGTAIRARVCVVGAGPAGLTVASELAAAGLEVCVLEAGPQREDRATRRAFNGENGDPFYYRLDRTRAWGFGGSSQRWEDVGVRLHPIQPIDLEARSDVPHSGWPFGWEHLEPYLRRAQTICRAGPFDYRPESWRRGNASPTFALPPDTLETIVFQLAPEARFDHRLKEFAQLRSVRIILNSTGLELCLDETGKWVKTIRVGTATGTEFVVEAGIFVVACGGIENARLLLTSNGTHARGVGNLHGLVGRFFMEHPHMRTGMVKLHRPLLPRQLSMYGIRSFDNVSIEGTLRPTPDLVRREGLLNSSWWVFPRESMPPEDVAPALMSLRELTEYGRMTPGTAQRVRHVARHPVAAVRAVVQAKRNDDDAPASALLLAVTSEQAPNPESRVELGGSVDRFGRRKARLNWQLSTRDLDSIERTQHLLGRAFEQAGIGVLRDRLGEAEPLPHLGGGAHHMGTTRMNDSPKHGVVDANCRVHGVGNLYVTGSSVFPTGGYANPQLTLLALAVRLADHLKARISPNLASSP